MEIYVSTDVKADGPIPGPNSRPSFASAARTEARRNLVNRLEQIIRTDTHLIRLLNVGRAADLPQWRVVAGCIYQTVWNSLTGRPPGTGINDYDLIYFDGSDLTPETEAASESQICAALPAFPAPVEVRNQARVHLWFEEYFGIAYAPLIRG